MLLYSLNFKLDIRYLNHRPFTKHFTTKFYYVSIPISYLPMTMQRNQAISSAPFHTPNNIHNILQQNLFCLTVTVQERNSLPQLAINWSKWLLLNYCSNVHVWFLFPQHTCSANCSVAIIYMHTYVPTPYLCILQQLQCTPIMQVANIHIYC